MIYIYQYCTHAIALYFEDLCTYDIYLLLQHMDTFNYMLQFCFIHLIFHICKPMGAFALPTQPTHTQPAMYAFIAHYDRVYRGFEFLQYSAATNDCIGLRSQTYAM